MSKLTRWQALDLAIRSGDSAIGHIVFTGDSGIQDTVALANAASSQLADLLTAGGRNIIWRNSSFGVKATPTSGVATPYDTSLTLAGTLSGGRVSFGRSGWVLSSPGATVKKQTTGFTDTCVFMFRNQVSGGSVNIDAGSGAIGGATSLSGTDGVLVTITKTATRANNLLWTATTTSAANCEFVGVYAWDSTVPSILVHNGGGSQWPTGNNGGGNAYLSSQYYTDVIAALNPALGVYSGGGNDALLGYSAAGCLANMRVGFAALPNDRVMLTTSPLRISGGASPISQATQDQFADINRQVGFEYDAPIVDWYASYPNGWTQANAQGEMLDDYHRTALAQGFLAQDIYALLIAP